jgi:mono/diheme cytochrome c family protein
MMPRHARSLSGLGTLILAMALPLFGTTAVGLAQEKAPPAPTAAADKAAQIAKGGTLFISYGCGWCHADGGRKDAKCPQLMNDPHDDDFLLTRIAIGSPGRMPAFGQSLAEPEIQALIAYIRNLKPD